MLNVKVFWPKEKKNTHAIKIRLFPEKKSCFLTKFFIFISKKKIKFSLFAATFYTITTVTLNNINIHITAIIVLIGHTDALKATALIFGRSNSNKTATSTSSTTTTTTTTSTTTISPADVDEVILRNFLFCFCFIHISSLQKIGVPAGAMGSEFHGKI